MKQLLDGRVASHLAKLDDPAKAEEEWPQLVEVDEGPINVTQKRDDLDDSKLIEVPKAVVKVMRGPYVEEFLWVTKESDVDKGNLIRQR